MATSLSFTFISSLLFTLGLIKLAPKMGMIDIPNSRSSHSKPTPRGGGIAITISIFIGLSFYNPEILFANRFMFLSLLLVTAIGVFDDIMRTKPIIKFFVIGLASTFAYFCGFAVDSLGVWLGYSVPLGFIALPFTVFAIVGFTNSINLVDGLDGLATLISIVILSSLAFVGYKFDDEFILVLSLILISSLVGFLLYNRVPAKIFQGDAGALTIGFLISIIAIRSIEYVNPVAILLIAFVPILDTIVVMIRRIINGKSPFKPDKTHLHHQIVRMKNGDVGTSVLIMVFIQMLYSILGLTLINEDSLFIFLIFAISVMIFYQIFTHKSDNEIE